MATNFPYWILSLATSYLVQAWQGIQSFFESSLSEKPNNVFRAIVTFWGTVLASPDQTSTSWGHWSYKNKFSNECFHIERFLFFFQFYFQIKLVIKMSGQQNL